MTQRRSPYDKRDSLEMGMRAEKRFHYAAIDRLWDIFSASPEQDMHQHWDFQIGRGIFKRYRVDVKSMMRIRRWDTHSQDEWAWISFHGVRKHDPGWLYGKAHLIAFEMRHSFLLVGRRNLATLAAKLTKREFVSSAPQAKYRLYQSGRSSVSTMIETEKLRSILWDEWTIQHPEPRPGDSQESLEKEAQLVLAEYGKLATRRGRKYKPIARQFLRRYQEIQRLLMAFQQETDRQ